MKLKYLVCAAAMATCLITGTANAFLSQNALGIALGKGTEINYQRALTSATRLEVGVGWDLNESSLSAGLRYHVLHRNISDGFHWYLGPGAGLYAHNDVNLYVGLPIGIEYNFKRENVPLLISLDLSPGIKIIPDTAPDWNAWLGIRWTF